MTGKTSTADKTGPLDVQRILIKVSGELLDQPDNYAAFLDEVVELTASLSCVLVLGGGNFFRGRTAHYKRAEAMLTDAVGMSASLANALRVAADLREKGRAPRVVSPFSLPGVTQPLTTLHEPAHLTIVGGGIGLPYVSTDTAAVLAALQARCQIVLKGTKVQGVYSADPAQHPEAAFFPYISFQDIRKRGLVPMDAAALALAETHHMPLRIFKLAHSGALMQVLKGEPPFTHIGRDMRHV